MNETTVLNKNQLHLQKRFEWAILSSPKFWVLKNVGTIWQPKKPAGYPKTEQRKTWKNHPQLGRVLNVLFILLTMFMAGGPLGGVFVESSSWSRLWDDHPTAGNDKSWASKEQLNNARFYNRTTAAFWTLTFNQVWVLVLVQASELALWRATQLCSGSGYFVVAKPLQSPQKTCLRHCH